MFVTFLAGGKYLSYLIGQVILPRYAAEVVGLINFRSKQERTSIILDPATESPKTIIWVTIRQNDSILVKIHDWCLPIYRSESKPVAT